MMLRSLFGGLALAGVFALGALWGGTGAIEPAAAAAVTLAGTAVDEQAAQTPGRVRQQGRRGGAEARPLVPVLIRTTAELTNQTPFDVTQALTGGQSLAAIATAGGSSAEAVVAEVMTKAQELMDLAVERGRLTQREADLLLRELEQRATELMNDPALGEQVSERLAQIEEHYTMPALVREASIATGLPPREITEQLRNGKSLTEIVTEAGGDITQVINAATATFRAAAEEAVE
jgi:polyhydroxyalkanoate synthesis regulator phasin